MVEENSFPSPSPPPLFDEDSFPQLPNDSLELLAPPPPSPPNQEIDGTCLTVSLSLPVCMCLSLCLSVTKCLTIKGSHFCHHTQYKDSVIFLCTSPDFFLCFLLFWCYLSELHLWFFSLVALLSRRSRHRRSPPSTRSISLRVRSGPASRCRYTRSLFLPAVQSCKMMLLLRAP